VARVVPTAALVALAIGLAWHERGSISAADWLGYAIVAGLALVAVAASGAAAAPHPGLVAAAAGLVGLGAWDALSLRWSATPSLARDEALLVLLYAIALVLPALSLRGPRDRLAALGVVAAGLGGVTVATAIALVGAGDVATFFIDRRLDAPISYPNAQASFFLLGLWPGLALAARRTLHPAFRALALASAAGAVGGWAMAQSKGGAIGLAGSAVVVFAVSRDRLRLAVPAAIVAALCAIAFVPLTGPYRADDELAAIHRAGAFELALVGAAALAGLAYALLDRRVVVSERWRRRSSRAVAVVLAAAVVAGVASFFAAVEHPGAFAATKWRHFKSYDPAHVGSSHLSSLGSNRWDFWRVAADEFAAHPLAGIGARGFREAYLLHRRSNETPARAHSLELDTLSETGIVGFALLALALVGALVAFARRTRGDTVALGALGAFACWLTQASVDWTWTFPAIGVVLFVLLGVAAARDVPAPLARTASIPVAVAAAVAVLAAFGPPWLSDRYVSHALAHPADAQSDLRRARRLDPLSTEPLLAEWALAPSARAAIPPLVRAADKEPRLPDLWYRLGRQYLQAGQRARARAALERALALDPNDDVVLTALREATG
jgi:hypothetical protein